MMAGAGQQKNGIVKENMQGAGLKGGGREDRSREQERHLTEHNGGHRRGEEAKERHRERDAERSGRAEEEHRHRSRERDGGHGKRGEEKERHREHERGRDQRNGDREQRSPRRRSKWSPDAPQDRAAREGALPPPPLHRNMEPPLSDTPPAVGSVHQGLVHTVKPFGLFIAIHGYRRHVLVHHTQVGSDIRFEKDDDNDIRMKALDYLFPKGQAVWVKVVNVEPDERSGELRVNGSMKAVSQEDGTDLDPGGTLTAAAGPLREEPPEVGSIHHGTVKRIEAYGVFVALDGFKKHGLVHSSQVSTYLSFTKDDSDQEKKAELSGVVASGDRVFVKVVEVGEDDGSGRGPKIGLSMKLVDQKTGEDMDPLNSRYKPRGEGGPGGRPGAPALGAAAGNVIGGKMDWGHLAGDNRLYVGDHKGEYKMLEETLPPPPPRPPQQTLPTPAGTVPAPAEVAPQAPKTVEEALAIIEQFSKKRASGSKEKKKSKDKSKSKDKDKKRHKDKKKKRHKKDIKVPKARPVSSGSSSDSSSGGSE